MVPSLESGSPIPSDDQNHHSPIEQFTASERQLRGFRAKVALVIGGVLMPMGAVLDRVLYPEEFADLLAIRLVTTFVLLVGLVLILRVKLGRALEPLSFSLVFVPTIALNAMVFRTDGGASPYFYGLILLMIVVHLLGFTWRESLVYCTATIAVYTTLVLLHGPSFDDLATGQDPRTPQNLVEAFFGELSQGLFFLVTSGIVCVAICYVNRDNRFKSFQLQQQAQQQAEQQVRFLADVSHELRTPLTLIAAPLDDLLSSRDGLDQAVGERLAIMRRNVARLRLLVDDVMDVVGRPSSDLKIQREEVDLRVLLDELVTLTADAAHAAGMRLELTGVTSPVMVGGDRYRLERVVLNLLTNAMKFSPPESTITIRLTELESFASIEVLDQGPGIPVDQISDIFRRHHQAGNVDAMASAKGVGLGLAIAQQIIAWHGGQIDVVNQEGGGAKFQIMLPLLSMSPSWVGSAAKVEPSEPRPPLPAIPSSAGSPSRVQNPTSDDFGTVLIIDDEPELRSYLSMILTQHHHVHVASNATDGIRQATELVPDCILLDLMLPDARHLSALEGLRRDDRLTDCKILMLTANADETIKLEALQKGSDDFLSKPFGVAELVARVNGLVKNSQLQRDLRDQKSKLAQAFDDLKESEAKLLQSEKMRAIATLAGGLLHEINNPVNFTKMAIEVLKRKTTEHPEIDDTLNDIRDGVERISEVLTDLREFAHPEHANSKSGFNIADAIRTACRFASGEAEDIEVDIDEHDDGQSIVFGSRGQVAQVLTNLLTNATNAISKHRKTNPTQNGGHAKPGKIQIGCRREGDRLLVTVSDNGPGMSVEQVQEICKPFFTTDPQRGLGLGLSVSQALVATHGGKLVFQSELGSGTDATFDLPLDGMSVTTPSFDADDEEVTNHSHPHDPLSLSDVRQTHDL